MLDAYPTEWESFRKASLALCGPDSDARTLTPILQQDFSTILASGAQPRRHYHTIEHYRDVVNAPSSPDEMGPLCSNLQEALQTHHLMPYERWLTQVMTRAGWHHDVVYAHVDDGMLPEIAHVLQPFIHESAGHYHLKDNAMTDEVAQSVYAQALTLFGFHAGQNLNPYEGQNEFLSALYAGVRGLEIGLPAKSILAEMAMIEATIPFRPASRIEALKAGICAANASMDGEGLSETEIEAVMFGAVFMANHDVVGFRKPFEQFNRGSHLLLMEGSPTLQTPRGMHDACARLARFLGRVGRQEEDGIASVFHGYGGFPIQATRDLWDRTAMINCEVQQERMRSYAAAALLVAAEAIERGHAEAGEIAFDQLLTDASLEPPHHIFPRALHEVRLQLKREDVDALLGSLLAVERDNFPVTSSQARQLLAGISRDVLTLLHRHLKPAPRLVQGGVVR